MLKLWKLNNKTFLKKNLTDAFGITAEEKKKKKMEPFKYSPVSSLSTFPWFKSEKDFFNILF